MISNLSVALFGASMLAWVCATLAIRRIDRKLRLMRPQMIRLRRGPMRAQQSGNTACDRDRCVAASGRGNVVAFTGANHANEAGSDPEYGRRDLGDESAALDARRHEADAETIYNDAFERYYETPSEENSIALAQASVYLKEAREEVRAFEERQRGR